ncbi:uncharacterized protein BDR25DRAFT_364267 [Lindgomyces ingoldianus]|uniref:Uncharacterized protein n=1 Tax=Lindgomyces ingoldianus TaxID=673940 RepID=A0ACB6RGJ0_9PLEO|nr:uncharacterized protein BDR25DRAFT_364267 [Lindgomyces ingoldianus]KAF2477455.1 hypothetical protein BDR25DRAFT_364267 [Lindgomyces ingoldianus]
MTGQRVMGKQTRPPHLSAITAQPKAVFWSSVFGQPAKCHVEARLSATSAVFAILYGSLVRRSFTTYLALNRSAAQENEIERTSYSRKYRKTGVLSVDFVKNLFVDNTKDLRQSLEDDLKKQGFNSEDFQELEGLHSYVLASSKKLYAILLYSGRSEWIVAAYRCQPRIDDRIFSRKHGAEAPQCLLEDLLKTALEDIAEYVVMNQWIIPPVLTPDTHRKFSSKHFRFPFVRKPKEVGHGSGGVVCQVEIAPGHLEAEGYEPGSLVAYKTVGGEDGEPWSKILQEVNTLRARKHDNIVPLFASFSAQSEEPVTEDSSEHILYMLFPFATGGDMRKWLTLETAPEGLNETHARQDFIFRSMQEIVSGLAYIHREIDQIIGVHHDLKPSNILLFCHGTAYCWKICDFGKAHLRRVEDGTGILHTEGNDFGTYEYRPPEYFTGHDKLNLEKHGRAFDIYGLGCVFLELATVYKYGWSPNGLPRFTTLRRENTIHAFTGPMQRLVKGKDQSFHNNTNIVRLWISDHLKMNNNDAHFSTVVDMIKSMLKSRKQRIFAWEVDMELYFMRNRDEKEEVLKTRFRNLVQGARAPLTALDNQHNPLRRAISKDRPVWWKTILEEHNWSNNEPTTTGELARRERAGNLCSKPRYSTLSDYALPFDYQHNRFFSRHKIDAKITKGFKESNCVGLWGLPGVGKSHLAYRHADRYRDPARPEDRKHTFWVNAANRGEFDLSLKAIYNKINASDLEAERKNTVDVRDWLTECDNGPWIMVLDSLDDEDFAKRVAEELPTNCGQILITTVSRAICKHFMAFQEEVCLQVNNLELEDRRAIFRYYNRDPVMDNKNISNYLLEKIYLPDHTKFVATYLAQYSISAERLYHDLKAGRRETIHDAVKAGYSDKKRGITPAFYADKLFSSLIRESALRRNEKDPSGLWPCDDMHVLGKLSCLGQDMHSPLIEMMSEGHSRFDKMLGELRNLSFLTQDKQNNYYMPEFLHGAVHDWVEERLSIVELLKLHEFALKILLRLYRKETKGDFTPGASRRGQYCYLRMVKFRAHFDRFLDFVRSKGQQPVKYGVSNDMVEAVHTFSQLYLDDAYYEAAIDVLRFMFNHYREQKYRSPLRHLLTQAYISSSSGTAEQHREEAEFLLKDLETEANSQDNEMERVKWTLLSAQLWNKSSRPDESLALLTGSCDLHLTIKNGEPILAAPQKWKVKKARTYAIRLQIEQARAHLAKARLTNADQDERKQQLGKAFSSLQVARRASSHWFKEEHSSLLLEIEEIDADVSFETGEPDALHKAAEFLASRVEAVESECKMKDRAEIHKWDLQCKLARVWAGSSDTELQKKAADTLAGLLKDYRDQYGKLHGHTLRCAEYLAKALEVAGNHEAAQQIKREFQWKAAQ